MIGNALRYIDCDRQKYNTPYIIRLKIKSIAIIDSTQIYLVLLFISRRQKTDLKI